MKKYKSPLASVYITNYNYGKFLEESVESVLKQTFQDFELFIIDDGSTDQSQDVIKKYEEHKKIFVIQQKNKGLPATNNVALKMARGKYFMRLDADDYLDPHALEVMISTMEKNPRLALVFPDYYIVDKEGEILNIVRRHNFKEEVSLLDQPAHGACTIIRKNILLAVGGYDETFSCQDGFDLWLKIAHNHPVQNINLPLFYYRQHGESLSTNEEKLLSTRAEIKKKHLQKRGIPSRSILTIIPVRGHKIDPRSLPLSKLSGKFLIDWTVDAAIGSDSVNDIMVTTPDAQVCRHIKSKYKNVIPLLRNPELARINTHITETITDALNFYCNNHPKPELIMVLYIESPFRSSLYVDKAINTMQLYNVDVVDGVRLDDDLFYLHQGNGLVPWEQESGLRLERKNLYRRAGGIHLISREFFETNQKLIGGRIGHIIVDQKAAFSIKSEFDWQMAKYLATKK